MSSVAKITSKGQVTIPKEIRKLLNSDLVEFAIVGEDIVMRPVKSVGGSLSKYAKKYTSLNQIRDKVWENVAVARARKETT